MKRFFSNLFKRRKGEQPRDYHNNAATMPIDSGSSNNETPVLIKTLDILTRLEAKGYSLDGSNAKLISPIEACRPVDMDTDIHFVCEMYPALTDARISEYSKDFVCEFPAELKKLYKHTNGIRLFARYINITGLCSPFVSMNNSVGKVPTPIRYLDNSSNAAREKNFRGDGKLFFAWYDTNPHTLVYIDCSVSSPVKPVYTCYEGSEEVLASWPSFDEWFSSEYEKYSQKYDNGEYLIKDIADGMLKILKFL